MELEVKDGVQYLHVAAVDVAGNVSETTHICVDGKQILWKLHTKQLKINEAEGNVYPAAADKNLVCPGGRKDTVHVNECILYGRYSQTGLSTEWDNI